MAADRLALAPAQPDPGVALLVAAIGPGLGLDPASVTIETALGDTPAAAALGPMSIRFNGPGPPSRSLVAHELAHVAHHRNRGLPGATPDVTAAEAEANALAGAVARSAPLWVPRASLPAGRVARSVDGVGVAASSPPTDKSHTLAELDDKVVLSRAAELRQIVATFSDTWTSEASARDTALRMLEALDFTVARSVVRALGSKALRDSKTLPKLVQLSDEDHKRHPGAAAAVLSALPALAEQDLLTLCSGGEGSPMQKALHGLTGGRLPPEQLRAVLQSIHEVFARKTTAGAALVAGEQILIALERGDRRDEFRDLFATPAPPADDAVAINTAYAAEDGRVNTTAANGEPAVDGSKVTAAADGGEAELNRTGDGAEALKALGKDGLLPSPADSKKPAADANPTAATTAGTNKPAATTASNAPPPSTDFQVKLVTELDHRGLVDKILDNLRGPARYELSYAEPLMLMLAARSPALTLPRIESLLSYGPLNWWWVSDDHARFSYTLIHSMSLQSQDQWRAREDGKWSERLERNYPFSDPDAAAAYTGVGTELRPTEAANKADAKDVDKLIGEVQKIWDDRGSGSAGGRAAAFIALVLAGGSTGAGTPEPVRMVATRKLDAEGLLVKVYDKLPDYALFSESGRQTLLTLSSLRDPLAVVRHVNDLLSTGIFAWWVSSRTAWIASQLIRSLPSAAQEQWNADHPGLWAKMTDAMTPSMRDSLATGAATGRGEFPAREKIRERLIDPALWADGNIPQLRALMALARASDDAEFVFEQSKQRRAFEKPWLKGLVDWFELYDEKSSPARTEFKGEGIEPLNGAVEFFRWVNNQTMFTFILVGAAAFFLDRVSIGGYSVKVNDLNLNWAQWAMGGDAGSAKLSNEARSGADLSSGPAEKPKEDDKRNRLSAMVDLGTGALRLSIPELRLERVNVVKPGASYRTGPLVLKGLRVKADFSDRGYKEPVGAEIDAERLDVDDLVFANTSLPEGAIAAGHLQTHPLHLKAGATGKEDLDKHKPREGTIPIPILGPLLEGLANIVAIKGGIPGSPTLVDLALMAPTWNMNFFASHALSTAANKIVPSPAPLDYAWGYFSDGVLRPPRSATQRMQDAVQMLHALEASFDELRIDGLTLGSGTQLSSVVFKDVSIGFGTAGPLGYLRMMQSSLKASLERAKASEPADDKTLASIQERLTEVEAQLKEETDKRPGFDEAQAKMQELQAKDRWNPGSLKPEEARQLAELSDLVGKDTSLRVRIGSVDVGQVSGRVQTGGASIRGIRLDGSVPLGKGGYYDDTALAQRFIGGDTKAKETGELVKGASLSLSIDEAKVVPLPDGTALRIAADSVPSSLDLQARLAKLPADVDLRIRDRLLNALQLVKQLEQLRADVGSTPAPSQQDQIHALTDQIKSALGVSVRSIDLGKIDGGLDENGNLAIHARGVDIADIQGDGFAVGRVHGSLELGVAGLGKLRGDARSATKAEGIAEAKRTLGLHFGVDLKAEDIATDRVVVKSAAIDVSGDLRMESEDTYVLDNVVARTLSVDGVNVGLADSRITAGKASIEGISLNARLKLLKDGGCQVSVPQLHIDKISANGLNYHRDGSDGSLDVRITSGALGQIDATDLSATMPKEGPASFSGGLALGGIDDLKYSVVQQAINPKTGKNEEQLSVVGQVKGGSIEKPVTGYEGAPPPVLKVGFASDGTDHDYSLDIAGLKLLGTRFHSPDGHLTVTRTEISGQLRDVLDKDHPDRAQGTSADITLTDTVLRNVGFGAGTAYITNEAGEGGKGGTIKVGSLHLVAARETDNDGKPTKIKVDLLELTNLDADKLAYSDGAVQFYLGKDPSGAGAERAAHVDKITLSGFVIPYKSDGKLGKLTSGHASMTGTHLEFGGAYGDSLESLTGRVDVTSITVELTEDSQKITVSGASADADVTASVGDTKHPIPLVASAGLSGLGVTITHTKDAWEIDGLHLDEVHLKSLFVTGAGWSVWTKGTGVKLKTLNAKAKIKLTPAGGVDRVVIEQFKIDRIEAAGFTVRVPGKVVVDVPELPAGANAVIDTVELVGPTEGGTGPFEYLPGGDGTLSGFLKINSTTISKISADVAGKFKGDVALQTGTITLGSIGDGKYSVNVKDPKAKLLADAELDSPDRKIFVTEAGAGNVHVDYDPDTKKWEAKVTDAYLDGFKFAQPGVIVRLGHVKAPGDITFDADKGKIPELDINDASIWLDLKLLLPPSPPSTGPGPVSTSSINDLLDALDGHAQLRFKFGGLIDDPIGVDVTRGRINYDQIAAITDNELYFDVDGDTLALKTDVKGLPIQLVHWHLVGWEVREAADDHTVRLKRLGAYVVDIPSFGSGSKSSSSSSSGSLKPLFLDNIDVDFSTKNKPIPISFSKGAARGTIVLAKDGLSHAQATGMLMPLGGSGSLGLRLSGLAFDSVDLHIATTSVQTDEIVIGTKDKAALDSGTLFFDGTTPASLSAHITQATAHNIRWSL